MKLVKLLANLGYGSRKQVTQMLRNGWVMRTDGSTLGPDDSVEPADIVVDDEPLDPPPGMVLMLHKPIGVTCSTRDAGGVIYDLLPPRFRLRNPVLSSVGRLDRDTRSEEHTSELQSLMRISYAVFCLTKKKKKKKH